VAIVSVSRPRISAPLTGWSASGASARVSATVASDRRPEASPRGHHPVALRGPLRRPVVDADARADHGREEAPGAVHDPDPAAAVHGRAR
jgi:hypothetical protein